MTATLRSECLVGIVFGLSALGLSVAIGFGRIRSARGMQAMLVLLMLDLWRGGVGVNPQTPTDFFDPAPGLGSLLGDLQDGRVFSFGVDASPAVRDLIERHESDVGRSSFLLTRRVLTPFTNLIDGIDVAEGSDRLSFVPTRPAIAPTEYSPEAIGPILQRLRNAAVVRVVSLDPLQHSDLRLRGEIPAGPRDLSIRVYDLLNPWPRAYVACRERDASEGMAQILGLGFVPDRDVVLDHSVGLANCSAGFVIQRLALGDSETYDVDSMGPGYLVMRDSYTPSWTAAIDGRAATVVRANGWQRAVLLPGGRHRVSLRYAPPGLRGGALATAFASLLCLVTWKWPVLADVDGRA